VQGITTDTKGPDLILFFSGYELGEPVRNQQLSAACMALLKGCARCYIRVAEAPISERYNSNSTGFSTPAVEKDGERA
jgi:hypothetical protein